MRTGFIMVLLFAATLAHACDTGSVRDAAFHGRRDFFRLGLLFHEDDPEGRLLFDGLSAWFAAHGAGLNIYLEALRPDDVLKLRHDYGLAELPETLPVTVLAAFHPTLRRPAPFTTWTPAPAVETLAELKSNGILQTIARDTPEYWGVLLYARGKGADLRDAVEAVAEQWRSAHAPGVSVLNLDRRDPDNAWLCAVAGIEPDGEDWVGIVFARGKLLLPVLTGSAITKGDLDRLLNRLAMPCTCLQQASTLGIDLPMYWDERAESDFAVLEMPMGYTEMTLDDKVASLVAEIPEADMNVQRIAAFTLLGAAAVVLIAVATAYWRHAPDRKFP